jgi:DNA polymerase-3 subunit epsilon
MDGKLVWEAGEAVFGFGKHRGASLRRVAKQAPGYLEWMLEGDFTAETKQVVRAALRGEFPKK